MDFDSIEEIKRPILNLIEGLDYRIHDYGDADETYNYLKEDESCITIKNIYDEEVVYIDITDELTLTLGAWHAHYDYDDDEYNEMLETLKDFIENKICTFEIYRYVDDELKWFGSYMLDENERNSMSANKLIKKNIDKKMWPIKGKAIFRYFDENKTETHEYSFEKKESN